MHSVVDIAATFQEWVPETLRLVLRTVLIITLVRHFLPWLHQEKGVIVFGIQHLLLGFLLDSGFESFEVGQLFDLKGLEFV